MQPVLQSGGLTDRVREFITKLLLLLYGISTGRRYGRTKKRDDDSRPTAATRFHAPRFEGDWCVPGGALRPNEADISAGPGDVTAHEDDGYEFALCLTHDVDRPFKTTFHAMYYSLNERDPCHLRALVPESNPYWQFDDIRALEKSLGVRSAFYFLSEPSLREHTTAELLDPATYVQLLGRYDVHGPEIGTVIRELDAGGWEVGLHGSYHSPMDRDRLHREKRRIESVLGGEIRGGRQHYLNLSVPETWSHHREIGLSYDCSLGSTTDYGFQHGYDVHRPFGDDFVVFPLTVMDQTLPDPGAEFDEAWSACESLLDEAVDNDAVMTALWHPRLFSRADFPGYRRLYQRLVQTALDRGAWVGAPGEYYDLFLADSPSLSTEVEASAGD